LTTILVEHHAPNSNKTQPPPDHETPPDATPKIINPTPSPGDPKDLPDLEDEDVTGEDSQNPSVAGSKELRLDDPEEEATSKRAKGGGGQLLLTT
jgi:hypothetical protein